MQVNIEERCERSSRLDTSDIDFSSFRHDPLPPDALRCLRYMHDVELHTVCYLRDLLVTRAHQDPEITAFLSMWAYEEYWHGAALGAVLRAHGEPSGEDRVRPMRGRLRRAGVLDPIRHSLLSAAAGDVMTAVQMTWGAVNEWTTQAGYGRLVALTDHPTLRVLLTRIMKQEGRHIDFYAGQAHRRLAASAASQRVTRTALRWFWRPVGSDVMPAAETEFLIGHLFGGSDGHAVAARIDRRIDRLPGLGGLHLIAPTASMMGE